MQDIPEIRLLCECISPLHKPVNIGKYCADQAIDWSLFLKLVTNHRVIPLVYQALKTDPQLPDEMRTRLKRDFMQIAGHSLRAACVLQRLQTNLDQQGIDLIPVKGPALALLAYGRESRRQFEDLDIIVRQQDLLTTVDLLEKDGYAILVKLTPELRKAYLKTEQDWKLQKPGDPLQIELKPSLIWHTMSRLDSADYMSRMCQPLAIDGRGTIRAPGPEAMLLAVCMDGCKDMWSKLGAVADIGHLLTCFPNADWQRLLGDAAQMGQRRTVLVGAQVAALLLDCPLPDSFITALHHDRTAERLAKRLARQLLAGSSACTRVGRQCLFTIQSRERWRDRWRFMFRLLCVPSLFELHKCPLPTMLFFLYALARPWRLAWDLLIRRGQPRRIDADESED